MRVVLRSVCVCGFASLELWMVRLAAIGVDGDARVRRELCGV